MVLIRNDPTIMQSKIPIGMQQERTSHVGGLSTTASRAIAVQALIEITAIVNQSRNLTPYFEYTFPVLINSILARIWDSTTCGNTMFKRRRGSRKH
mmetsp:Transcript_25932/g.38356  ORF Transcript_25932/g.38356 Transcript_25932/m.38356 type:complete len:96 (-) Transcript_25932:1142-1429(-)